MLAVGGDAPSRLTLARGQLHQEPNVISTLKLLGFLEPALMGIGKY
jgi:hypothetical protein